LPNAETKRPINFEERIEITVGCKDYESITKVKRANYVVDYQDMQVQVMHDGTLVSAVGYCGKWMTEIV